MRTTADVKNEMMVVMRKLRDGNNRGLRARDLGTFGIIKWDRSYKRLFRRGQEAVILELSLISCGFNLMKYHNKKNRAALAA